MIVPVSSERYASLFAEAANFLNLFRKEGEAEITINNINQYYSYMNDFYRYASVDQEGFNNRKGYKYIMMPLDKAGENVFDINLNTRTITIPVDFVKVGGVQSDQMAELIIFSVDFLYGYGI